MVRSLFILIFVGTFYCAFAQQKKGLISGSVLDEVTQTALRGVDVLVQPHGLRTETDSLGFFSIEVPVGIVNITFSLEGHESFSKYNVESSSGYVQRYVIQLNKLTVSAKGNEEELEEVLVTSQRRTVRATTINTPLSVQKLTAEELRTMPGGNFDLSRAVQSLPGVASTRGSTGGYRNDIIVRGGATNENVYYLDGIEVPVINHFNTQGGSGGVEGILNVYFVENLKLSSSSFDARYDNVLSSVFEIKQRKGNLSKLQGNMRSSLIESQLTLDGPIGKSRKLSFIASARASYLGLLFTFLDLPVRPNYVDYQFKLSYQINPKTSLTAIGFGAVDWFGFVTPQNSTPQKLYLLNSLPGIFQYSYTAGVSLRRALPRGYFDIALSINSLYNQVKKKNTLIEGREDEVIFQTDGDEREIKLRANFNHTLGGWKLSYGGTAQLPYYSSEFRETTFSYVGGTPQPNLQQFAVAESIFRYGLYVQAGKQFFQNRFSASFGVRVDGNSFTSTGSDLFRTLSPRASLSYSFHPKWKMNLTGGIYYKLLPFNTLFHKDAQGVFANQGAEYLRSSHGAFGFEFLPSLATRFTIEGFYKAYNNMPVSVRNGISLSNIGVDYGTTGNEAITSTGDGTAYGLELFMQQKLLKNLFFIVSYTWYRSFYSGSTKTLLPASWDNQHIGSISFLVLLPRNWSIGARLQYQGAAPYTPFDMVASRSEYLSTGKGVLDYTKTNTERLTPFHNGDLRIEKKWYYKNHTFSFYFLVANVYAARTTAYPYYSFKRNVENTAFLTTNGQPVASDGSNAIPFIIENDQVNVVPSAGIIWEFR